MTAQLAFAGQVISTLVASGVLSKQKAVDLITKLADAITSSLDQAPSDLQAIEALRNIAADL